MNAFKKGSFSRQVLFTMFTVALVPILLLSIFMMVMIVDRIEAQLGAQAQTQMEQVQTVLDRVSAAVEGSMRTLADTPAVRQALTGHSVGEQHLYQAMLDAIGSNGTYAYFSLHDSAGKLVSATGNTLAAANLAPNWGLLLRTQNSKHFMLTDGTDDAILLAATPVLAENGTITGYIVAAVTPAQFENQLAGAYDRANNLLLLSPYWRLLYHSQPTQGETVAAVLRQQLWNGQPLTGEGDSFLFHFEVNAATGFTVVLQQPNTFTASVLQGYYIVGGSLALLSIALCIGGTLLFSRRLSKPVGSISDAMRRVQYGDFDVRLPKQRNDELGRLAHGFNRMMNEYQSSVERLVARQKELNDTRIRMMQSQLNPHFLYNTLDSMRWLGVTHNAPKVTMLATDLASILRMSITGDEFITLEAELELVERYIDIQSIRFEDHFTCEAVVAEQFQSCMVPKLMLQPLVENAIIHGVTQQDDGYIKIWAEQTGGDMEIFVSDNGCGMSDETLDYINHIAARTAGRHLGLYNVSTILRLHYGAPYGIHATSTPGEGSRVSVRLPMTRATALPEGEEAHA